MSERLRSLRHERDLREHGDAVTTRTWWDAPGEDSRTWTMTHEGEPVSMSNPNRSAALDELAKMGQDWDAA